MNKLYWCHGCSSRVVVDSNGPLLCPRCQGEFLEELEGQPAPAAAASPQQQFFHFDFTAEELDDDVIGAPFQNILTQLVNLLAPRQPANAPPTPQTFFGNIPFVQANFQNGGPNPFAYVFGISVELRKTLTGCFHSQNPTTIPWRFIDWTRWYITNG